MAKVCTLCGKRPNTAFAVSHSNRHTKRRQMPNLQRMRILVEGWPCRTYVCSKCLKAGLVRKA